MKTYAVLFLLAFLTSFLLTPRLRDWFRAWGWLDTAIPAAAGERRPVPRLGGVAIYLAVLVSLTALIIPRNVISEQFLLHLDTLWTLLGPATLILLLGIWDDLRGMSARVKLTGQLAASLWLLLAGIEITRLTLPTGQVVSLGWLSGPVTVLWLIGITNAFNLMDGLDGLAAGIAFLSSTAILVIALLSNAPMVAGVTLALAGALLGFLRYNFSPATIFLGDSGSMFVGFVLAATAIVWSQKATTLIAVVAPLLALGLPITDTWLAMARRFLRAQPILHSDRGHIHHRLLELGLEPRHAVLLLYTVSAVAAFGCIVIARSEQWLGAFVLALFVSGLWIAVRQLNYPEFREFNRSLAEGLFFSRRVLSKHLDLRRRAAELARAPDWASLWEQLRRTAEEFDFDAVELELPPETPAPLSPGRHRHTTPRSEEQLRRQPQRFWSLTLPLADGAATPRLHLYRDRSRPRLPLQVDVLVEELAASVSACLNRLAGEGALPEAGVEEDLAAQPAGYHT
ncbi:MAG: undecaprenyl/decaprenyl-phosphate alpha-N-acetylglucosaminyl 1-phosphate transferase [Acidobacteria bacterium]|nr:undecaprenyl/decaprenyl-phosphate alpha-N-acetylglucosaminyl 1-phosphate transferase [Acidobacteriota bacterium]